MKSFAKVLVQEKQPGYPCPAYKLCILDEADALTNDAQTALRRIIEANSRSTRFILICNYISRIIEPLCSRCTKFRFRPLSVASGAEKIMQVARAEPGTAALDEETARYLLQVVAEGDLRRAITLLQGVTSTGCEIISRDLLAEFGGIIPDSLMQEAEKNLLQPQPSFHSNIYPASATSSPSDLLSLWALERIVHQGYSAQQFIQQISPQVIITLLL